MQRPHREVDMAFSFFETSISDLTIILPHQFRDERGCYTKYFEKNEYKKRGLPTDYSESSEIVSCKGTLRGLHYQNVPSQGKLIHVVIGSIFDVAVDLRKDSATFGKYECFVLRGNENKAVFIPENFAHGFLVLEDNTIFSYQSTGPYMPENNNGIIWNDDELGINWPLDELDSPLIVSEKDRKLQTFADYRLSVK
jgi:dTDP-4-dehydrorhamnose 3,5-epimerase